MSIGAKRGLIAAGVVVSVAIVAAAVSVAVLGGGEEPKAVDTASAFVAAWSAGDGARLRELAGDPAALDATDPVTVGSNLGATTSIVLGEVTEDDDNATAPFTATLTIKDQGDVRWDGSLPLVKADGKWAVTWSETALHPQLPEGGTIRSTTKWPERAPILGVGDQPLVGTVATVRVGIEPGRFDRVASTPVLAGALQIDPALITAALDAPGVKPNQFVQIAELPREAFEAVRPVIFPIPGVTFPAGAGRGGPTPGFARHLLGRFGEVTAERLAELGPPYEVGDQVGLDGLEARFETELAGRPGLDVTIVDGQAKQVELLASFPGTPPVPVRTTIDPVLQAAAEATLADVAVPAALVAVDAATGQVRASVSRPLDDAFNRAIASTYPPGSTFKIITGYALLTHGLQPTSTVTCPPEFVVDGRRFRNFEGNSSGSIPFSTAFAESCNTAFMGAAKTLPEPALGEAAATFGFGLDYSLGPKTLGGSFPAPASPVDAAAAVIGQAQVVASPLHMATVAAAVLDGTWRTPVLLPDNASAQATKPLDPAVRGQLADLMRLVVTSGSGTRANVPGLNVIGKSGTAEFGTADPPATHAWFVSAVNGLGIAVVLEGGGVGGVNAAPVAGEFLRALPR